MIDIKAILHTWPGAEVSVYGDEVTWHSMSAPSDADLQSALDTYAAHVTATAYKDDRKSSYPTIGDQLDMLWHAIDTGNWTAAKVKTTDFYTELKAVKADNPKPEGA